MKIKPTILIIGSMLLIAALALAGCSQAQATTQTPTSVNTTAAVTTPAPTPAATAPVTAPVAAITPPPTAAPTPQATSVVKIGDILKQPKQYAGKPVVVQGKIVNECGSGCWFTLNDNTGTIYIDLAPNNMVIPQKRGSNAKVSAVVEIDGKDVFLVGSKVDF
jgi:uncharacterized protein YdeI (BOF family)